MVFVQGARQTGKSTLVRHMRGAEARPYFTLDDAATLAAAEGDPTGFVSGLGEAVVIDEVQRAPGLALAIKAAVDRGRRPGRFLLTGSANALVLPKLAEALAGRIEIHTLWPLSQGELEGRRETFLDAVFSGHFRVAGGGESEWPGLVERMGRGGYPEMLSRSSEERRRAWFGSYVTSIVQRDVRDITNIRDVSDLPRLLALVGTRAASLLDYADIARGTGIPQTTVKRHMALLEATFLVQTLPAWFTNIGKRLVKAPKMLINDTGLLMYLLGTGTERLREDRTLGGSMLENFVAMELFKQSGWSKVQPKLHHFRTHGGEEVDLVLEDREGRIVGIEVKASASVNGGTFRGLQALAQAAGNKFVRGVVLYTGGAAVSFGEKLVAAPVDALWG
ncbi:MAG TPA: ATP-binding protein [Phycisphaerae bacterium]|nr:ATP-binding protein [Phycisphaerae bacterium]